MDLVVVQRQNILHSSDVTSDDNQATEEQDIHSLTEEELLSEYADLFRGLGNMEVKLHLDVELRRTSGDATMACPNSNEI